MIIEEIYNDQRLGKNTKFFYLSLEINLFLDKLIFSITEMPDIGAITLRIKEFEIVDKKSYHVLKGDNRYHEYGYKTYRMIIYDKSNIEIGKKKLLDVLYDKMDRNIDKKKEGIEKINKDISDIINLQQSSIFRYKKLDNLLGCIK